ncbi:MAG: hypothetical protein AB7H97_22405 [Pseudobdellovibrionaceae bacterium]
MSKRKLKNYILNTGLAKGHYLYVFAGSVSFLGVLMIYAAKVLRDVNMSLAGLGDLALAAAIQDRLFVVALLFFASFLTFIFCTAFFMIVIGQRVLGPSRALTAYIRGMQAGNFDPPRPLRKNDELVEIHEELSKLADALRTSESR